MNRTINFRLSAGLIVLILALIPVSGWNPATATEGRTGTEISQGSHQHIQLASAAILHGNQRSRVFHRSTCRYYNCKNCLVILKSRGEALKAGFRPCKICRP